MSIQTTIAHTTNIFGPTGPEIRARLAAVCENPTQATWEDAHSIILNGRTWKTLWQAVLDVDPSFVRRKPLEANWPMIPSAFTIRRAIREATR